MKFLWWPNTKQNGKEYNEADIVEQSAPYIHNSQQSGVYFLLDCDRIVYVGKTIDVKNRLKQHSDSDKIWNRYFFIRCDREEIDRLEAYYILRFRPKYNIAIPKGGEL
jgi:excinuclease UvrABC nuclease subunit